MAQNTQFWEVWEQKALATNNHQWCVSGEQIKQLFAEAEGWGK